jgi:hypothetical protein
MRRARDPVGGLSALSDKVNRRSPIAELDRADYR